MGSLGKKSHSLCQRAFHSSKHDLFFSPCFGSCEKNPFSLHGGKVPNARQDHIGQLGSVPAKASNDLGGVQNTKSLVGLGRCRSFGKKKKVTIISYHFSLDESFW